MFFDIAYLYFLITGRAMNSKWTHSIFCQKDGQTEFFSGTTETTVIEGGGPRSLDKYLNKLVIAPSDGHNTFRHFLPFESKVVIDNIPILVLGAAEDTIYPPSIFKKGFVDRYPNSTHAIVSG